MFRGTPIFCILLLGSQPPSFLLFTRSSFVIFLLVSQIVKNLLLMTFSSLLGPYFTHLSFSLTFLTVHHVSAVLRIRIHRIHMFLDLPYPDPLVRGTVWIRILLSSCKNSKKNLDSYYFVTL
jgi:hypothetical protein